MCMSKPKMPEMPPPPPPVPPPPTRMTKKIKPTPSAASRMTSAGFKGSLSKLLIPLNLPQ